MSEFQNGVLFGVILVLAIEASALCVFILLARDDFPSVEEHDTAYWLRMHERDDE